MPAALELPRFTFTMTAFLKSHPGKAGTSLTKAAACARQVGMHAVACWSQQACPGFTG